MCVIRSRPMRKSHATDEADLLSVDDQITAFNRALGHDQTPDADRQARARHRIQRRDRAPG